MPSGIYKRKKGIKYGMTGKKHSLDSIEKMRLSQSRRKRKPLSEEHKQKIREKKTGNQTNLWKGGKTKLTLHIRINFKYRQWRSDVLWNFFI